MGNADYALGVEEPDLKQEAYEEYVHSPVNSLRCEMPSTKFHEPKEEQQPPFLLLSNEDVQPTIQYLFLNEEE